MVEYNGWPSQYSNNEDYELFENDSNMWKEQKHRKVKADDRFWFLYTGPVSQL